MTPVRNNIVELPQRNLAPVPETSPKSDILLPVREWLDGLEINDPRLARLLCQFIPAQCPFEREIMLFGHTVVHIPPLCTLNPLFEQIVALRFRALSYLAEECGEDIAAYI
jgi:Mo-dependent nitrogenase C-terminus